MPLGKLDMLAQNTPPDNTKVILAKKAKPHSKKSAHLRRFFKIGFHSNNLFFNDLPSNHHNTDYKGQQTQDL